LTLTSVIGRCFLRASFLLPFSVCWFKHRAVRRRELIPHLLEGVEVSQLSDRILEILRNCPRGLTAKELAEQLGATSGNISSRLSKLAAYGVIEKTRGGVPVCSIYNVPTSSSSIQRLTAA
jgi:hypothetical protein